MRVKKQDWRSYEELAERIYRKLDPEAVVTHNDSIYGHDSSTYRQIDVSIRKGIASHDILVIVQARDRKRGPDVNDIGEFASVVKDVRAAKGVMVTRKPPGKNAANLAKRYGIDICSAFDVNDRKWEEDVVVPVIVTLLKGVVHPDLTFASDAEFTIQLPPKPAPGYVSCDGGNTRITLLEYMAQIMDQKNITESGRYTFTTQDDSLRILLNDHDWVPLPHIRMTTIATVSVLFRHCRPREYLALRNYSTGQLTIAEMKIELPPFDDPQAWQEGVNIRTYEKVMDSIPIVDLRLSSMSRSGSYGLRILPLEDRENW